MFRNTLAKGRLIQVRFQSSNILKSDINITRTGDVKIAVGHNGRSSRTGYTATVFGASGFLGRYLTSKLAKNGTITVVPFRDELKSKFLKVPGDLGVVNFVEFDIRNLESINEAVKYSDIVYNLIGVDYDTRNFTQADVNIEAARRIAQATKDHGVPRLVHVSSYNADPTADNIFFATKGHSEAAVRAIYPDATIVRPAPMYGREDKLLNVLAEVTSFFTFNHNRETLYPAHVLDVATALEKIGFDDSTTGQTFELYGQEQFSIKQIRDLIEPVTRRDYKNLNVPKDLGLLLSKVLPGFLWPSQDQINKKFIDQNIDTTAKTFDDLKIVPDRLQDLVFRYTHDRRTYLHAQDLPPTEKELREKRETVSVLD
ncbi:NADH dehydrogenase [ubiquinone] 1 alpha subcomplex subunit 9, mitochondrial [Wickerhamomyces ciferrii]|uniref:NADH dehydrogenase [ubiquinone] 1 alpha subcomplex subunit 9, mitochondrial n=1 Tax=Wickerhamomyces ciferrii (strain ATCC 14091 / BCRC 22168 / CBS 111 / JCM 3599 / NBRC 0793 / NRRL Y-1031 F-60-10) TaxID=1206466 RepID=K0KUV5_WICCF|nr:NADH dehydrogenase [ubiquinone] 1 alpha subcomplex subunit 9, mitochondrial [Wickerhamomyces ciferrii]CCH47011.1 NADH dehydrogenase [ubiquinone] 1 alpha subcomplex subunit 9, mitochondrial [Wickerhamomyces ciferrii]